MKNILKKSLKIFAGSKKVTTFATAFEKNKPRKGAEKWKCKVLEKKCKKICKIKILALSLQSVRVTKTTNVFQTVLWFTGYFLREKECSIYLSILLNKKRNSQDSNKTFYFIQWRVWSWLRMNASGRPNTCKSRGSTKGSLLSLVATGARVRNAYATYP